MADRNAVCDLHEPGDGLYRHVMIFGVLPGGVSAGLWRDGPGDGPFHPPGPSIRVYFTHPDGGYHSLPVPEYVAAAFEAYEPVGPLIDYLIEAHGARHPWLHALAARFAAATP